MMPKNKVEVKTPARLHLGLLDTNGSLGRFYGSIGVAIDHPNVILEAEPAETLVVEGREIGRVTEYARRFLNCYPALPAARLNLKESIPAHAGLGSGTQLALATGAALARLGGLHLTPAEIALALGRGQHSGIGIAAFQRGGFVLDGGHRIDRNIFPGGPRPMDAIRSVPPVLFQHAMPHNWRFILAVPRIEAGISGDREQSAFRELPQAPSFLIEKICRLLVMKMLPGLLEEDISSFGEALTEIQRHVGECFSTVQGGQFANPLSEKLIGYLAEEGAAGAGQSSWGPTVYGLVESAAAARQMEIKVGDWLAGHGGGQVCIARPANHGARVRLVV